jgi:hypothetical protein
MLTDPSFNIPIPDPVTQPGEKSRSRASGSFLFTQIKARACQ